MATQHLIDLHVAPVTREPLGEGVTKPAIGSAGVQAREDASVASCALLVDIVQSPMRTSSSWSGTRRTADLFFSLRGASALMSKTQTPSCRISATWSWQISSCRASENTAINGSQNFSSRMTRLPGVLRRPADLQPAQIGVLNSRVKSARVHHFRWSWARCCRENPENMLVAASPAGNASPYSAESADKWRLTALIDGRSSLLP